jgi:hypothetical protein
VRDCAFRTPREGPLAQLRRRRRAGEDLTTPSGDAPVRIELKNIQHAALASQETACFTATVYLNGKRAGTVGNTGNGGCHWYDGRALESALGDYARTLPHRPIDERDPSQGTHAPDADALIDDLLSRHLALRDLRRALKRKVLFLRDGKVYSVSPRATQPGPYDLATALRLMLAKPETLRQRLNSRVILNLLPENEALDLYLAHG